MKYNLEPIKQEESSTIYQFLRESFFGHEPVTAGKDPPLEEEVVSLKTLYEGHSRKVVDSNGRILAVVLNSVTHVKRNTKSAVMKKMVPFFEYCDNEAGLDASADRFLYLSILAVHETARGQGLGKLLAKTTEQIANDGGFPGVRSLATSEFTSVILTKLGWTMVKEICYADYKDSDGNGILTVISPVHTHARVFIKEFIDNK